MKMEREQGEVGEGELDGKFSLDYFRNLNP